jgi:hypothetical protein
VRPVNVYVVVPAATAWESVPFMTTSYPVSEVPPSSVGAVHETWIEVVVALVKLGVPGAPGIVYGVAVEVDESTLPDALYAATLNVYPTLPVSPVTVVGEVLVPEAFHSVYAVAVVSL